jgi:hypothetical protein
MIAEPNAATAEIAAKIVDQSMYRAFRSLAVAAFVVVSRASNSIFVFRISSALAVPDLNLLVTTAIHRSFLPM